MIDFLDFVTEHDPEQPDFISQMVEEGKCKPSAKN